MTSSLRITVTKKLKIFYFGVRLWEDDDVRQPRLLRKIAIENSITFLKRYIISCCDVNPIMNPRLWRKIAIEVSITFLKRYIILGLY